MIELLARATVQLSCRGYADTNPAANDRSTDQVEAVTYYGPRPRTGIKGCERHDLSRRRRRISQSLL